MAVIGPLRHRLRLLVRSERGMALPAAIFALVASMGLATAAIVASVDVQRGAKRDSGSKNAIAAADAGASVALLRLNRYANSLDASHPCLGVSGGTLVLTGEDPGAPGWCAPISGSVGGASYAYRVEAGGGEATNVVATGTAAGVTRRVKVSLGASTIGSALSAEGVIGKDNVEIDNNADSKVGVGSNGHVHVHNNGNVCGNIRTGIGIEPEIDNNGTQCSGYDLTQGNVSLPPVSSFMPADIAENNDNYRLVTCTKTSPTKEPPGCQEDSYTGKWKSTVPWNPETRTILAANNTTLTLSGGDYFVCQFVIKNNSHFIMADGAQVRIFFDTPENCGLSSVAKQIDLNNNADITSTGYNPDLGKFDVPGFYLMGSPTIETLVEFSNNSGTNEFVLYAPQTDISIKNNAVYKGVIAGKTVHLDNNAIVEQDDGFEPPEIGGATLYGRQGYVECTGASGSPPDANC